MIDSHTHIFEEAFAEDLDTVVLRAQQAGVTHLVLPNIDVASVAALFATHQAYPTYTSMSLGLHPTSVGEDYREQLEQIRAAWEEHLSEVVAIGEVGLDYYWDRTFYEEQKLALRVQVEWAIEADLPLILHTREAHREMLDLLNYYRSESTLRGVFHSFTGSEEELDELIAFSPRFMIGLNGVVTFKKSPLREYLTRIPLDRLLLETDAPYLAPSPHRGRRNEPAFLAHTLAEVARAYALPESEVAEVTMRNAQRLFALNC